MLEEKVSCRGVNGSIALSQGKVRVVGLASSTQCQELAYSDVSAVFVQRKSVVPFATLTILTVVVVLVSKFDLLWFIIDLYPISGFVVWTGCGIAILCAFVALLRLLFVNVLIRSNRGPFLVRLVPIRSAKRLARRFSEISAEG
jgi:hypothetical protein